MHLPYLPRSLLLLTLPAHVMAVGIQGDLQTQWQSRYVTEGRDNLPGSSLFSVNAGLSAEDLSAGVWQAWEEGGPYRENNLYPEYAPLLGDWRPYANVTYLQFHPDDPDDVEVGAGVSRPLNRIVSVALDGTWSRRAEGSFYGLSLIAEKALAEPLIASLRVTQTLDHGYASKAYNGLNNTEAAVALDWSARDHLDVYAGWQYSWAGEDVRRDGGDDEQWGEIGLMLYF